MTLLERAITLLNRDRSTTVTYKPPNGQPFGWDVVLGAQVGGEIIGDSGEIAKVVRRPVVGKTADLTAHGVTKIQPFAKVEIDGTDWAIDTNDTRWGTPLVRLGLQLESLVREWQANRATV